MHEKIPDKASVTDDKSLLFNKSTKYFIESLPERIPGININPSHQIK